MAFKINPSDKYESINVTITKEKYPIIFANKVQELINNGLTKEQAEESVEGMTIELELYYEVDYGLFGVESEAVEDNADIASPYTMDIGKR